MIAILLSACSGLAAGAYHVLTGPDHLAAVAPLAIRSRRLPWLAGVLWGVGHSCGVWLLAAAAIVFLEWLPVALISTWSERVVGLVLIAIGAWALRRAALSRSVVHAPAPVHQHAALGIGTLHGLAGVAHLLGVLPALLLPSRAAAVAYVLAFGLGSIAAMSGFAWLVGRLAYDRSAAHRHAPRQLWVLSGMTAIGVGACWLVTG